MITIHHDSLFHIFFAVFSSSCLKKFHTHIPHFSFSSSFFYFLAKIILFIFVIFSYCFYCDHRSLNVLTKVKGFSIWQRLYRRVRSRTVKEGRMRWCSSCRRSLLDLFPWQKSVGDSESLHRVLKEYRGNRDSRQFRGRRFTAEQDKPDQLILNPRSRWRLLFLAGSMSPPIYRSSSTSSGRNRR